MTDKNTITSIKRFITSRKLDCKVVRIGTGKHYMLGLYGEDAGRLADVLIRFNLKRTPMSGNGTRLNPITLDR